LEQIFIIILFQVIFLLHMLTFHIAPMNYKSGQIFSIIVLVELAKNQSVPQSYNQYKVYLEDIPLDEAWRRFSTAMQAAGVWNALPGEEVPLDEALGRVTAQPVWARCLHRAIMQRDGWLCDSITGYSWGQPTISAVFACY
jgi:hypothetical protein